MIAVKMSAALNEQLNYTTINHIARQELGLSWMEYGLADLIYRLSNNPESKFPGYCYASKETLAHILGVSKQTIHTLINNLIDKGLIKRDSETKYLSITINWYQSVEIQQSKETLLPVKKVYSNGKESLLDDSKETLHNKENTEKEIKSITPLSSSPLKKFSRFEDLTDPDLADIAKKYHLPVSFVRLQHEKMANWLEASGKTYRNYKAALRNWVLTEAQKRVQSAGKSRSMDVEETIASMEGGPVYGDAHPI